MLPAYERDPYLTRLEAQVVRTGEEGGRPFAVLDDTLFYPEGGGQPSDRGLLGGVPVLEVRRREGEIRHYLEAPGGRGPVELQQDWDRRFDHMQQHTGQHLLTAVAQDRFGWATTAFHLGEEVCDIELDAASLGEEDLRRLEEAVAAEIRAGRPLLFHRVEPAALGTLKVRSRGLPAGFQGEVRLVEIQGVDLNTCGGTHLRSTGELEALKLLGTEPLRGGTRLFFAAGGRLRRRLGDHERRNARLRTLLGAPDEGLVEALEARLDQYRALERGVRALEEEVAQATARSLAAGAGPLADQHFEGKDAGFLQKAARLLAELAPEKAAFLTASREGGVLFIVASGPECPLEAAAAGKQVASLLQGRGGGSGRAFQGKAQTLAGRAEALAFLERQLP
jgi:Ser-tRNA(Ala) deacylase AlaX